MFHVLNVKSSSYYNWINRSVSTQQIHRNQCELLVRVAHDETKQRYGCEGLHAHFAEQGSAYQSIHGKTNQRRIRHPMS